MFLRSSTRLPLAVIAACAPAAAFAHPGHDLGAGLAAGLAHPLTGLDHAVAMLAIGAWAARARAPGRVAIPVAFLVALALGALLAGTSTPPLLAADVVEQGISASVLVIGALLACALRLPAGASCAIAAGFALFHGHAHGIEAPATGLATYFAGFLASSAVLLAAGFGVATAAGRRAQPVMRLGGAAACAVGAVLLVSGA